MNLTDIENKMLLILHSQVCKVIKKGTYPTERTFPSVLTMCDAWHVASICCDAGIDPKDASQACKGLIQKKLVREYEINRMPSLFRSPTATWRRLPLKTCLIRCIIKRKKHI
jgi:hypothetical protein